MSHPYLKTIAREKEVVTHLIYNELVARIKSTESIFVEYVYVVITNGRTQEQVIAETQTFLGDAAPGFAHWLWNDLPILMQNQGVELSPPDYPVKIEQPITGSVFAAIRQNQALNPAPTPSPKPTPLKSIAVANNTSNQRNTTSSAPSRLAGKALQDAVRRPQDRISVKSDMNSSSVRDSIRKKQQEIKMEKAARPSTALEEALHTFDDSMTDEAPQEDLRKRLDRIRKQEKASERSRQSRTMNILNRREPEIESRITKTLIDEDEAEPEPGPLKERCKYWPTCKNEDCPYIHPTEQCPKFPSCKFGNKCIYIHPVIECRFGSACLRPNCAYNHPRTATPGVIPSPAASLPSLGLTGVPAPYTTPACHFGLSCARRPTCPYQHPPLACRLGDQCPYGAECKFSHAKLCMFGAQCKRPGCTFSHPGASQPFKHNSIVVGGPSSASPLAANGNGSGVIIAPEAAMDGPETEAMGFTEDEILEMERAMRGE